MPIGCWKTAFSDYNSDLMNITFNELRRIKDTLPDGSIHRIAKELDLNVETVWNYFGGYNHPNGRPMGVHLEGGPDGGVVALDDTRILDLARQILNGQYQHA
jgi:molybdenum-dependent DNA-binding transcriptional regulator ModE